MYNVPMQFDLDICSDHSELFLHLRSIILSCTAIKEKKNAKQTSYYDEYSAVCFLRVRQGKVRLSFANGASLKKQFQTLLGESKIVRYLEFTTINDVDKVLIKEMINESLLLNIEKKAVREMKKEAKKRLSS